MNITCNIHNEKTINSSINTFSFWRDRKKSLLFRSRTLSFATEKVRFVIELWSFLVPYEECAGRPKRKFINVFGECFSLGILLP